MRFSLTGCAEFTPAANAEKCASTSKGKHCNPTCSTGYEPVGDVNAYTCGDDSQWNGGSISCAATPNWCDGNLSDEHDPEDPKVEISAASHPCPNRTVNTVCTASCQAGSAKTDGSRQYRCGGSKEWTPVEAGDPLICERFCPGDPDVPNSNFTSRCDRHIPGFHCVRTCSEGCRKIGGTSDYTYSPDGLWHTFGTDRL